MTSITIADLTSGEVDGDGVFDKIMQAMKGHLHDEYAKNRLRGPEYSTVYLTGMQSAMSQSIQFLLERDNAELIQKQIELAEKQLLQADKDLELADKAIEKSIQDILLVKAQIEKMTADEGLTEAQRLKLIAETLNVPKQGELLDQQVLNQEQQVLLSKQQVLNMIQEVELSTKKVEQLTAEILNIPLQGALISAQTDQVNADILNTPKEGLVLDAQKCKLDADFDLTVAQKTKVTDETALIVQKLVTERAQTTAGIAAEDSVIGVQNTTMYKQGEGYIRLSEQQAARIMSELLQVQIGVDQTASIKDIIPGDERTAYLAEVFDKLKAGISA